MLESVNFRPRHIYNADESGLSTVQKPKRHWPLLEGSKLELELLQSVVGTSQLFDMLTPCICTDDYFSKKKKHETTGYFSIYKTNWQTKNIYWALLSLSLSNRFLQTSKKKISPVIFKLMKMTVHAYILMIFFYWSILGKVWLWCFNYLSWTRASSADVPKITKRFIW